MFGDSGVRLTIDLNGESYVPGDTILGTLTVESESPLTMESIVVSLEGKAITRASQLDTQSCPQSTKNKNNCTNSSTTMFTEEARFLYRTVQVFPPAFYAQGLKQSCLTIQKGEHKYPFKFEMPKATENSSDPHWSGLPLPPSMPIDSPFDLTMGRIEYDVVAVINRGKGGGMSTLFSTSKRHKMPIKVASVSEAKPGQQLLFARRALNVPIFQVSDTWKSSFKRAFGLNEPIFEQRMVAEIRVPTRGIYISPDPQSLTEYLSLQITKFDSGGPPKEKATLFAVSALDIFLETSFRVQAQPAVESRKIRVPIHSSKPQWGLNFVDDVADLTELISSVTVPRVLLPTLTLPTIQVAYKLNVQVAVAPTIGYPVVSTYAVLTIDVPINPAVAENSPPPYSAAAGPSESTKA
ncbi:hypothetical protein B9G98_04381 [Wickerhamiella sorbophila]|uniref:Arrestin-like N-terminal domain-containing protein n=1 Tax=Wickerhamiella sorbophila TaxID=45607 RepID=A0A2T0FP43_9ASCO|nr:hypothetical protein B9G98_04381 [Wickerhamiella sorbophila]PRT56761.1 hypothetical protein B9G98_04381 [Wickerhamiella sorbophila]